MGFGILPVLGVTASELLVNYRHDSLVLDNDVSWTYIYGSKCGSVFLRIILRHFFAEDLGALLDGNISAKERMERIQNFEWSISSRSYSEIETLGQICKFDRKL